MMAVNYYFKTISKSICVCHPENLRTEKKNGQVQSKSNKRQGNICVRIVFIHSEHTHSTYKL